MENYQLSSSFIGTNHHNYGEDLYLDPVLLLRLLADESGIGEAEDAGIAQFLTNPDKRRRLREHIDQLPRGSSKIRLHVRKMLQKMATGAKSKELTEAVLPFLGESSKPEVKGAAGSRERWVHNRSGIPSEKEKKDRIAAAELRQQREFFAGTWIVESATMGKEKVPGNSMKYVFTRDGKLEMTMLDSKTAAHGSTSDRTYELDLSRTPKVITFSAKSVSGEPVSQTANYEIKDGKIYLTVEKIPEQSKAAGAAKASLSVEAKNGLVMVLVREKK